MAPARSRPSAERRKNTTRVPISFSSATNSVNATIQPRFIAPPTKASSMSAQQQAYAGGGVLKTELDRTGITASIATAQEAHRLVAVREADRLHCRPLLEPGNQEQCAGVAGV